VKNYPGQLPLRSPPARESKTEEEFRTGILANFLVKFPLTNSSFGNFPLHGKFSPLKIIPIENFPFPTQKMYK